MINKFLIYLISFFVIFFHLNCTKQTKLSMLKPGRKVIVTYEPQDNIHKIYFGEILEINPTDIKIKGNKCKELFPINDTIKFRETNCNFYHSFSKDKILYIDKIREEKININSFRHISKVLYDHKIFCFPIMINDINIIGSACYWDKDLIYFWNITESGFKSISDIKTISLGDNIFNNKLLISKYDLLVCGYLRQYAKKFKMNNINVFDYFRNLIKSSILYDKNLLEYLLEFTLTKQKINILNDDKKKINKLFWNCLCYYTTFIRQNSKKKWRLRYKINPNNDKEEIINQIRDKDKICILVNKNKTQYQTCFYNNGKYFFKSINSNCLFLEFIINPKNVITSTTTFDKFPSLKRN